jgi:hypothetical protein
MNIKSPIFHDILTNKNYNINHLEFEKEIALIINFW